MIAETVVIVMHHVDVVGPHHRPMAAVVRRPEDVGRALLELAQGGQYSGITLSLV